MLVLQHQSFLTQGLLIVCPHELSFLENLRFPPQSLELYSKHWEYLYSVCHFSTSKRQIPPLPSSDDNSQTNAAMVAGAGKRAGGGSSRGGIAKRRSAARTDRDGDLVMDSSSKGRGGVAKGAGPGRGGKAARSTRGGLNSATAQRDILRHVSGGEGALRPPRSSQSANSAYHSASTNAAPDS